ncbi:MAG: IS1380 family transposase, partial [bacterium]
MNVNSTVAVVVEGGGDGVVAHVGLHALGAFADRLGLGDSLSARIAMTGERLPFHDRGKVLTQAMLMLTGGGEACSDIEHLRSQRVLFGSVPSDSTLYRTFRRIDRATLAGLWEAMGEVRAKVWRRSGATTGTGQVVLDIDASLMEIHSENKEGTAATYKGGFGFHPMFCFADATGEALSVVLRPGNAGANTIADHLEVLDAAVAQLPGEVAVGHRAGDDPELAQRAVMVRTDSAGCSPKFAAACRARNIGFAVVARSNAKVHAALSRVVDDEARWSPALRQDGEERTGAAVTELTDALDLAGWPDGTRLIVRREPLHPGAQTSLFPS